jgi:hypothetical protein
LAMTIVCGIGALSLAPHQVMRQPMQFASVHSSEQEARFLTPLLTPFALLVGSRVCFVWWCVTA